MCVGGNGGERGVYVRTCVHVNAWLHVRISICVCVCVCVCLCERGGKVVGGDVKVPKNSACDAVKQCVQNDLSPPHQRSGQGREQPRSDHEREGRSTDMYVN